MITQMKWGAMYAELEAGEVIAPAPIMLGDRLLFPGDKISRIGNKARTRFKMKDGYALVYAGMFDGHLLFTSYPDGCDGNPHYYCFIYVDPMTLLQGSAHGCRDIKADELEMFGT